MNQGCHDQTAKTQAHLPYRPRKISSTGKNIERLGYEQQKSCAVNTVMIHLKAKESAKQMNFTEFVGGPSWCSRFMRQNRLSVLPELLWARSCQMTGRRTFASLFQEEKMSFELNCFKDDNVLLVIKTCCCFCLLPLGMPKHYPIGYL